MQLSVSKIMDTLFRCSDDVSNIFGRELEKATKPDSEYLQCDEVNKVLKFALVSMYCDSCAKPHWSVLIVKMEDEFPTEVNGQTIACLSKADSFEDAVEQFEGMMNIIVKN